MRFTLIICLLAVVALMSFQKEPIDAVLRARTKFNDHTFISYQYTSLWPDPTDVVDTASAQCRVSKRNGKYFHYDYVIQSVDYDMAFVGDELRVIHHGEKKVVFYPEDQANVIKQYATGNITMKYSPLTLVGLAWSYVSDTVVQKSKVIQYRMVEKDTVYKDKKIFVESRLFINASTALPERYEHRVFHDGKSSQVIVFVYSDYKLSKSSAPLTYTTPVDYKTEIYGQGEKLELLKEGVPAPAFAAVDMNGKPVNIESLKGKKVLLDFSVINCGYCKMALDHFNRSDFKLRDDVVGIYINPMDKKAKIELYAQRIKIPFPLIPEGRDIGTLYGVSAYPTFYLINEQGVIERAVEGYHEKFMEELSSK